MGFIENVMVGFAILSLVTSFLILQLVLSIACYNTVESWLKSRKMNLPRLLTGIVSSLYGSFLLSIAVLVLWAVGYLFNLFI